LAVSDEIDSRHDKLLIEDPVILNESASQDSTEPDGIDMQDKYAHLATIHWNLLKSSTLTFGDKTDVPTAEYFKKASFSPHGRNRSFIASNGRKYTWKMGWWTPTVSSWYFKNYMAPSNLQSSSI
jgi:hypothetical protein